MRSGARPSTALHLAYGTAASEGQVPQPSGSLVYLWLRHRLSQLVRCCIDMEVWLVDDSQPGAVGLAPRHFGPAVRSVCATTDGTIAATARAVPSPAQAACRRRSVGVSDVTGSLLLSASMEGVVERWRTR